MLFQNQTLRGIMKNKIKSLDVYSSLLSIAWSSGKNSHINLKRLREACPCAFCSGEKDVFGNVYKGEKQALTDNAFTIKSYSFIGLYGLKITWGDLHSDGIYTVELVESLCS